MSLLNLEKLLENQLEATGELNPGATRTRLHLPSGQTVVIPTELLLQHTSDLPPVAARTPSPEHTEPSPALDEGQVIPLIEEQLEIKKRTVETARVHLHRETEEIQQTITLPFQHTGWEVEHVPVQQVVADLPQIRRTDDLIIFPIVEERVVVTRELFLREEVHVRRIVTTVEKTATVALRRDTLKETRTELPAQGAAVPTGNEKTSEVPPASER